ncbi:MAG: radical SAM protein, partial [Gemmatimonadetes bacterium]|nr:radical SAM protein [Gemmatimonadota bacterium]NIR73932.1 radical SAM protein [Candidatus Kutchimonas denitrificans]NIR99738.1 radical SAM protein [Gemmatimonadota bacterium]NIT65323.1 radical SAM protein [Gemmatimonadota bacterium]NIW73772.1 radical SAM protein [Gemmatimonadota bacterium]
HYGRDLDRDAGLHVLLQRLLEETEIPWFRLLYIYSAGLRPELVELIAREERLLSYIDMPIQHASPRMLESMRRPERPGRLREKIGWLRSEIPDLTLRTTVVVGFPGETEEDFEALLEFVEEIGFDHLGAFAYSPQKGTRGAELPDPVPEPVKMERLAIVNDLQRSIVAAKNQERIGRTYEVLVDRRGDNGLEGRTRSQAFEIDGVTYLEGPRLDLGPGDLARATVAGADDADLWATVESKVNVSRRPIPSDRGAALDLQTAWGR